MSQQLIDRNEDLQRIRTEGYELEVHGDHLIIRHVPYLDSSGKLQHGVLVTPIDSASGESIGSPNDHKVYFSGDFPRDALGKNLTTINRCGEGRAFPNGLQTHHQLSAKPKSGKYRDYHHKLITYIALISAPVIAIDPDATAQTHAVRIPADPDSPFVYADTASTRAGISAISEKLEKQRVAIIGLGGTGSYILDLVAKTPVSEIHLFDRDEFLNHNAFRAPGAASIEQLRARRSKVEYFGEIYSQMHKGIRPHQEFITAENLSKLEGLDFVFVAVDSGEVRKLIIEGLLAMQIPFIDVGMGVEETDTKLRGQVRVTVATQDGTESMRTRTPTGSGGGANEYARNIQIADLNALNASLAVIRWKKWAEFYLDQDQAHNSLYTIDGNRINNEECVCEKPCEPSLSS